LKNNSWVKKNLKMCELLMKKAMIFIAGLCFVIIWAIKIQVDKNTAALDVSLREYSIPRQVQYHFTLQNKSNRLLNHAEFWTYAPVKRTATQHCSRIQSSHPYKLITDVLGNQILIFTFNEFLPYGTRIITVKAELLVSHRANPMVVSDVETFLKPEAYIESDNPELCRLAKTLKDTTPLKTAERIFQWIVDNVHYAGYLRNDRGALYALRHRQGDCTEFMYLFAALCRSNNIPARCMAGYICKENIILKPATYHNWAEFYIDGEWSISDPQKKIFMKGASNYIAMRLIGISTKDPALQFNRYGFKGEGLKVKMNS
jgi:transglutaminase-like putative cysteine protease